MMGQKLPGFSPLGFTIFMLYLNYILLVEHWPRKRILYFYNSLSYVFDLSDIMVLNKITNDVLFEFKISFTSPASLLSLKYIPSYLHLHCHNHFPGLDNNQVGLLSQISQHPLQKSSNSLSTQFCGVYNILKIQATWSVKSSSGGEGNYLQVK